MWELEYKESWAPKNWCFWTVVLEKTLESPLDCKEIQPVHPEGDRSWCSLKGLMLKLKLQCFGHLMRRHDSFEKILMLGKIEGRRRRGQQRIRWLMASLTQWTWVWVDSRSWWWTGRPRVLCFMGSQGIGHGWATELNWSLAWRILSIILIACEMSAIVRQFGHSLALPFFGIGMKTDLFQSHGHCWVFLICWHIEGSTFTTSSFRIWNSSTGIPLPPLALSVEMLRKAHMALHSRMSGSGWVITLTCLSVSWSFFV